MTYWKITDNELYDLIFKEFGLNGGVYKLHYLISGNLPAKINRFLETDNDGVLYIGMSNSFVNRVIELKKTLLANYKTDTHIAGRRFSQIKKISEKYNIENFFVSLIVTDEPEILEKKILHEYEQMFGELPPLNRY